jgi:uncharacterized membrane protein YphA (DoxX/SURF4 family)
MGEPTVNIHHSGVGEGVRFRLATLLDATVAAVSWLAPIVDLLVRVSLAKAFFAPGMLAGSDFFAFGHAAWGAVLAEVAGPILFALGLWMRPVALLMLVLTLRAQAVGPPQDEHLFWAALFGWYIAQGAGALSLDHVLTRGLGISPLPLAGRAVAAVGWFDRRVAPLYRLAVRVWLAGALAVPGVAGVMLPDAALARLSHPGASLAAALLAFGFATPLAAAGLLLIGFGMAMAHPLQAQDTTLYGPLLLALLGVYGAGRYSLDYLLVRWLHRAPSPVDAASLPHVVWL